MKERKDQTFRALNQKVRKIKLQKAFSNKVTLRFLSSENRLSLKGEVEIKGLSFPPNPFVPDALELVAMTLRKRGTGTQNQKIM